MTVPTKASSDEHMRAIRDDIAGLMVEAYRLKMSGEDARKKAHEEQEKLLLAVLEVVDNFERVLSSIEPRLESTDRQTRNWVNSFRSIYKLLSRGLREQGVARIEAPEGKAVPGSHNIVETRENLDLDDGTIVEEWKKGYLWRGQVLRLADVVVVKN